MRKKPEKTKVKNWLKNKGHDAAAVDAKSMNSHEEIKAALWELHGVD